MEAFFQGMGCRGSEAKDSGRQAADVKQQTSREQARDDMSRIAGANEKPEIKMCRRNPEQKEFGIKRIRHKENPAVYARGRPCRIPEFYPA